MSKWKREEKRGKEQKRRERKKRSERESPKKGFSISQKKKSKSETGRKEVPKRGLTGWDWRRISFHFLREKLIRSRKNPEATAPIGPCPSKTEKRVVSESISVTIAESWQACPCWRLVSPCQMVITESLIGKTGWDFAVKDFLREKKKKNENENENDNPKEKKIEILTKPTCLTRNRNMGGFQGEPTCVTNSGCRPFLKKAHGNKENSKQREWAKLEFCLSSAGGVDLHHEIREDLQDLGGVRVVLQQ